jgi:hypothetical protein
MKNLVDYSNANPFKVPNGYFADFEKELLEEISQNEESIKKVSVINNLKPYLAIAAGFLLIFAIWGVLLKQFDNGSSEKNESAMQYSETRYLESVSSDEMIEMLAKENAISLDLNLSSDEDVDMIIEELEISDIIDAI